MDRIQTLGEVISMLRRRILLWVPTVALGFLISMIYALSLPQQYETFATIQIEQPSIQTGENGNRTVNAAMLQKLQIVEQRVMARENLLTIIEKFNLYAGAYNLSATQKVQLLREAASVVHIINPEYRWRQDISPSALMVTVRMVEPTLAANVANELINNVLEQEQRRRSARVRETLAFFEGEDKRIGNAISELEDRIANFKQENSALLPGGVSALRNLLAELQKTKLEVERGMVSLQDGAEVNDNSVRAQRARRLQEELELYQIEIARIEAAISASPEVDREFSNLKRMLKKLEDQFEAITIGKAKAEMNQMLETASQSSSFAVLERALPPDWPIAPSRRKILAMGVLVSALIALILVLVAEIRNPVIWTKSQFERQLGMRAIATIPVIEQATERRKRLAAAFVKIGIFTALFISAASVILKFGH
ncbi:Wzz/FepE/Etk N-terminal domain-containing protein [Pseudopelagicola sp. nBUS_19]|uniref:Wzz/FepE/Etk N-terminal domain-containing protein n=1 Tax=unclassified Pseudopelagicola TaxID=2649563 RepID=UPI003EC0AB46|nr:hypothetical protein [Hyphomicrobiales bacterium]